MAKNKDHDSAHESSKYHSSDFRAMDRVQEERDHCGYPKDSKHRREHYHAREDAPRGILTNGSRE